MSDPLSLLASTKKKEVAPKAAPKAAPSVGSRSLDLGAPSFDVSESLGRSRPDASGSKPLAAGGSNNRLTVPTAAPRVGSGPPSPSQSPPPPVRASDFTPPHRATEPVSAPVTYGLTASSSQQDGRLASVMGGGVGVAKTSDAKFEDMLEGERVWGPKQAHLKCTNPFTDILGRVLFTNYRVKFQNVKGGLPEECRWMQECKLFDVPWGLVEDIKSEQKTTAAGALEISLRITTKDGRLLAFLMNRMEDCKELLDAAASFSYPGNTTLLFAFKHFEARRKSGSLSEADGWSFYDPVQDYARMGVDTDIIPNSQSPWKVSVLNEAYGLCPTYPASIVLPRVMNAGEIRQVAGFRKRGRLPAMSWCGGPELGYASVWRCAQTTEGLMGVRACPEDEKMVQCIRQGPSSYTHGGRDLLLIDLRPWKSAWANKAGGGGFEGYHRCNLVFGGIDNIHCVRDAWKAMGAAVNTVIEGEVGTWFKDVAKSGWYDYIGAIIQCAYKIIIELKEHKSNVMIHCSDGWDRTAQTSSLTMLCMDPYYRTQAGFLKLIQKEWCSFGHKFRTRAALGEAPTSEASPIFVQWLDAVFQIVNQFSTAFEFLPTILLRLTGEVYCNRYGTFLCDSEKERTEKVAGKTVSLWSDLLRPDEAVLWRNEDYRPERGALIPSVSQATYSIWEDYWFRYHPRGYQIRMARAAQAERAVVVATRKVSLPVALEGAIPMDGPSFPIEDQGPPVQTTAVEPPSPSRPPAEGISDLFSPEEFLEVKPVPKPPPPKQVFNDDDDEDIFILKPRTAAKDTLADDA